MMKHAIVVHNLDECLSHLHADIVLDTLKVALGSLKAELGHLDVTGNAASCEQCHIGSDAERCAGGIGVGVGVVNGQASAE